jgi:hypothetical protein
VHLARLLIQIGRARIDFREQHPRVCSVIEKRQRHRLDALRGLRLRDVALGQLLQAIRRRGLVSASAPVLDQLVGISHDERGCVLHRLLVDHDGRHVRQDADRRADRFQRALDAFHHSAAVLPCANLHVDGRARLDQRRGAVRELLASSAQAARLRRLQQRQRQHRQSRLEVHPSS